METGRDTKPLCFVQQGNQVRRLFDVAEKLDCSILATGHYARTVFRDGLWRLCAGRDLKKDQSYFLWTLTSEKLSRIRFPLGELTKAEARRLVGEAALPVQPKESQDVCFIPDGDCGEFLQRFSGQEPEGKILGTDGRILGTHSGLSRYTVGQRKGLGVSASQPLYVTEKRVEENAVVLGDKRDLYKERVYLRNMHFISGTPISDGAMVEAKVRYTRTAASARYDSDGKDKGILTFTDPVRAPAPGQSAVFYRSGEVLGGGIINSAE